jgi:predicted nucleic acid-binding protein
MRQIKDRAFLDTNVLVYLYSVDEAAKRQQACSAIDEYDCIISVQTLNEFSNVCLRKLHMPAHAIGNAIDEIASACKVLPVDIGMVKNALSMSSRYGYSYFDCLMLAAAIACDCRYFLTEDMQNGQKINETLTIVNIF